MDNALQNISEDFQRRARILNLRCQIVQCVMKNKVVQLRTLLENQPLNEEGNIYDHEQIMMAAYLRRLEVLKILLDHVPSPLSSHPWIKYARLMHHAVVWGDLDILDVMICKYSSLDFDETDELLNTPLDLAFHLNRLDIACMFLCRSHTFHLPEYLKGVQQACTKLRTLDIIEFLNSGESINETVSMESNVLPGWSLLHIAVMGHVPDLVIRLLDNGADLCAKNKAGMTPVHLADDVHNSQMVQTMMSWMSTRNVFENVRDDRYGISFFHLACKNSVTVPVLTRCFFNNDLQQVDISEICKPTSTYPGYPALHFAIITGNESIVKFLVSKEADICQKNSKKKTAIHLAYELRNKNLVKVLLESLETYDNITDLFGFSHYHIACATATDVVNKFIKAKKNHDNAIDNKAFRWAGYTPLHFAVEEQHYVNVMVLLSKTRLNINALTASHKTALHLSIEKSFTNISQILIARGANLNILDNERNTPLHLAYHYDEVKLVKYMLKHYKDFSQNPVDRKGISHFHIACKYGAYKVVEAFLNTGTVNINQPSGYENDCPTSGQSPLFFAVGCAHVKTVKVLLHYGAEVNVWNARGETPLLMALEHLNSCGHYLVELLLSFGADVNMPSSQDGYTALHRIALFRLEHTRIVQLLLASKADPNKICNQEHTPLHLACMTGKLEVVKILLDAGADINARNLDGLMPIHILVDYRIDDYPVTNNRINSDDNSWDNSSQFRKIFAIVEALFDAGLGSVDADYITGATTTVLACERRNPVFLEVLLLYEPDTDLIRYAMSLFSENTIEEVVTLVCNVSRKRYLATQSTQDKSTLDIFTRLYPKEDKTIPEKDCCDEIEKMKMYRFNSQVVLFDVLSTDLNRVAILSGNTELMDYLESKKVVEEFPLYGNILRVCLKKGQRRRKYLERVKKGVEKIVGGLLPDHVFQSITSYVGKDEESFKNLLTAMNC